MTVCGQESGDALALAREILHRPQEFALITVQGVRVLAQAVVDLNADLESKISRANSQCILRPLNFSDDMGCASRAEIIAGLKERIGTILINALGGKWPKYLTPDGFTRWGLVQDDINTAIEVRLRQ